VPSCAPRGTAYGYTPSRANHGPRLPPALLRVWITLFFLLSGATALVYQVIWVRMLGLVVGHSVLAVAVVVATYMAGLGLGARLAGGAAQRASRPLVGYGLLEIGIGLFALSSPAVMALAASVPVSGTPQLLLGGLALLPPTLAMGATLPLLTAWYARDEGSLGRDMGWLYAVNTTGAFLGAGIAGFALLPSLGQPVSLQAAAAVNLVVGVAAALLGRLHPYAPARAADGDSPVAPAAPPDAGPPTSQALLLLAFALSGSAAMVNQVAWSRSFSLFTGSTTYAFSLIVCAFIAGLAFGGHLLSRAVDRIRDRGGLLAGLNIGIAVSAAVIIPIIGELPLWLLAPLAERADSFAATQRFVFAVLFGLLFVPTLLMGGTYPVVTRALSSDPDEAPAQVGRAYAWNTAGAILGSLGAGLVAIPALGLRRALWLAVALNLLAAAVLLSRRSRFAWALPALGLLAMVASPAWNPRHMNLAPHIYAGDLADNPALLAKFRDSGSLRFHEEGMGATISVLQRDSGAQVLRINGKTDASTEADKLTQGFIGALPILLSEEDALDEVLLIGLGSGMTLATTLEFPADRVRTVELLPEVVRGARSFGAMLDDPLDDPRLELIVGDGRHLLMSEDTRYDAIISEPTNLFISGMSTMFTAETFAAMREGLADGGVALVWVQGYLMFDEDFKAIARTFQSVFPETHLWSASPYDLVFTGHTAPLSLDAAAIEARLEALELARLSEWVGIDHFVDLQRHYLMGPDTLAAWVGDGPVHADSDPFLEFSAPRALFTKEGLLDVSALVARRELLPASDPALQPALTERRAASLAVEQAALGGGLKVLTEALERDPTHRLGLERLTWLRYEHALTAARRGDLDAARAGARAVTEMTPTSLPGWQLLSAVLVQQGDIAEADAAWEVACAANPWSPYVWLFHAQHLGATGRPEEAREAVSAALALDPELPELN